MGQQYSVERSYECDPNDLAVAFYRVALARYGEDAVRGFKRAWWAPRYPLAICSIKVGPREQAKGVRGFAAIEAIPADFRVGGEETPNIIAAFNVTAEFEGEVNAFLDAIAEHLEKHSIYRGKAITSNGEFLDLTNVSRDEVVYNEKVWRDLKAHVWTLVERAELCAAAKVGLPRKVLFEGPYGSGKTLAALLTARVALEQGFTFFYVVPTAGNALGVVRHMLAFARRYPPSIVFIEDIDREQREGNSYELGAIMTEIDGICSKNRQMLVIMTTNHNDKISHGMCRPGRIDKVIHFGTFTSEDIERLLKKVIPSAWIAPDLDWSKVGDACKHFSQAFVCEAGKAAMLLGISENDDPSKTPVVTEAALIEAAGDLKGQHEKSTAGIGFR